MVGEDNG